MRCSRKPNNQDQLFHSILLSNLATLRKYEQQKKGYLNQVRNSRGDTLLKVAIENNNKDTLVTLLEAGCDPNLASNNIHVRDTRPITTAIRCNNLEFTEILLKHGAQVIFNDDVSDFSICLEVLGNYDSLHSFFTLLAQYWTNSIELNTLKMKTVSLNRLFMYPTLLKILLDKGIDVNKVCIHGYTMLDFALFTVIQPAAIKLLIDKGADIHKNYLAKAVLYSNPSIIKLLLESGATVETAQHLCVKGAQDMWVCEQPICLLMLRLFYPCSEETPTVVYECAKVLLDANPQLYWECTTTDEPSHVSPFSMYTPDESAFLPLNLAELLLAAGSRWCDVINVLLPEHKALLISKGYAQPRGLIEFCRFTIRRLLGQNIKIKLQQLGLPSQIEQYLLLKDLL